MILTVNGQPTELPDGSTVTGMASQLAVPERGVAVAVDGWVVPRSEWDTTALADQQAVEIVTAMQGG